MSTDSSFRGPEFTSLQPHGGSQPSVIGSGDPSSNVSEESNFFFFFKEYCASV